MSDPHPILGVRPALANCNASVEVMRGPIFALAHRKTSLTTS